MVDKKKFLSFKDSLLADKKVPPTFVCSNSSVFSFKWIFDCDATLVLKMRNSLHVLEFMKGKEPISQKDHMNFILEYVDLPRIDFIFFDSDLEKGVGGVSIQFSEYGLEIGKYIGDEKYLGRSIAKRAMACLLDFICPHFKGEKIISRTKSKNKKNIELNKRLGFEIKRELTSNFVLMEKQL